MRAPLRSPAPRPTSSLGSSSCATFPTMSSSPSPAEAGARGVIVDRRAILERPDSIDALHAAGMRVVVYTLNDDSEWDEVTGLGVDGIVTDDPDTLSEWQSAYAGP